MEPDSRRAASRRLPERVYWFRRALALIALLIVIAFIMWLLSIAGGRANTAAPGPQAPKAAISSITKTPSPAASHEATALPANDQTRAATTSLTSSKPTPTPETPTSAAAQPSTEPPASPTECSPAQLALSITGPGILKPEESAAFTIAITNSGSVACVFTFDARFEHRIVSGSDEIWSTTDCEQWAPTGTQTLNPAASATWESNWDRHRSQAGCKVVPSTLKPGTYVAEAMYAGAKQSNLVMLLTS